MNLRILLIGQVVRSSVRLSYSFSRLCCLTVLIFRLNLFHNGTHADNKGKSRVELKIKGGTEVPVS